MTRYQVISRSRWSGKTLDMAARIAKGIPFPKPLAVLCGSATFCLCLKEHLKRFGLDENALEQHNVTIINMAGDK